ncbi:hypothetical protein DSO57_1034239 [Entomophthora muscae]|uniref:Uncharacterized protein n=1 Tax=Entomophthora muscae TaxID=34485 RepID=A0ACC2UJS5_9FUNG|nr:hypothetical protein DSO57_1034239 [Entomophthora muscae]
MYSTQSPTVRPSQLAEGFPYYEGVSSEAVSFSSLSYDRTPDHGSTRFDSNQSRSRLGSSSERISLLDDAALESHREAYRIYEEALYSPINSFRSSGQRPSRTSLPISQASESPVPRRLSSIQLQTRQPGGKATSQSGNSSSGKPDGSAGSPFIPLLERVRKVNGQLPDRFRAKPTKRTVSPINRRLTVPKAPKLLTEIRSQVHPKPPSPVMPEPFRARPVNPKILLSRGNLGVPRIIKAHTTIARSPNIGRARRQNTPHPKFARQHRASSSHRTHINHSGHKFTVPHPFTFASDKIAAAKMQEFDRKVREQMLEEDRARCFKATPMPTFSPKALPKVPEKPVTVPKPFVFAADARAAQYERLMQQKINEEGRRRLKENPLAFRARPAPKLAPVHGVRKSTRPLTVPQPFVMYSEQRVQLRRVFDDNFQKKQVQQEEIRQKEMEAQKVIPTSPQTNILGTRGASDPASQRSTRP